MNLKDVALSIYSFGYAAGFITDRRAEAAPPRVSIDNVADIAEKYGLGGIEFPADRYFKPDEGERLDRFIGQLNDRGLGAAVDLENFEPAYVGALLPVLRRRGLTFARIKMSGFYGGNRYREPTFADQLADFIGKLRGLLPQLRNNGVKLLIENHQDLGADDLIRIVGETSADCVGINWDVGNSLAVLDTPATFLDKAGGMIGNVHLKDYRLFRCKDGFRFSRCALGEGVVDFAALLPKLKERHGAFPMAIELGAQVSRQADVFARPYWEAYRPFAVEEKLEFFSFLDRHLESGDGWKSTWEQARPGGEIVASEMSELDLSVKFLTALKM